VTVLDPLLVERITVAAREVHFVRTMLTLVGRILWGLGWIVSRTVVFLWFALTWIAAAFVVGWKDARKPSGAG
jgi:hypothetical protein